MTEEVLKTGQKSRVCLFDLGPEVLQKISTNEKIFQLLMESGNDDFLEGVDMFLELSDENSMWVVEDEDKGKAREEWLFELPVEIAEEIKRIAEESSREKIIQGSTGDL